MKITIDTERYSPEEVRKCILMLSTLLTKGDIRGIIQVLTASVQEEREQPQKQHEMAQGLHYVFGPPEEEGHATTGGSFMGVPL